MLLGAILVFTGLVWTSARAPLTEWNVNLYCGMIMLLFGGVLLWLSRRRA